MTASCKANSDWGFTLMPLIHNDKNKPSHNNNNKKFELMLMRRAKAYSSSGSVV